MVLRGICPTVLAVPEGHTIHRYARLHRRDLGGSVLRVSSPQGRFEHGAARLDGRRLEDVEAVGKHLFYRWEGGRTLHVHLGLFGKFRTHRGDPPPPTGGTRLAMASDGVTVYLAGPTDCSLVDPGEEERILSRLGPDPLRVGLDGVEVFRSGLQRRSIPIAEALLEQKVVAGVGNVYRSEVLFLEGIDPRLPAGDLDAEAADRVWRRLTAELRRGERSGRIVTVDPLEVGARTRGELAREERLYVYKRDGLPCRRCGAEIVRWTPRTRAIWTCPSCQRAEGPAGSL